MTKTAGGSDTGAQHAYSILHVGFALLPIIMGADKFFDFLANWPQYLAPIVSDTLKMDSKIIMQGVGVVEILAGILVMLKPRIGAYVVAAWLAGIIVNLLL